MKKPRRWSWKDVGGTRRLVPAAVIEEYGLEFQIRLFEDELEVDSTNLLLLVQLRELYTEQGWVKRRLAVDTRLVDLDPNEPDFHYNLARSYSLLGRLDAAFRSLRRAVDLGYQDAELVQTDRLLDNLRQDPRFQRLVEDLENVRG